MSDGPEDAQEARWPVITLAPREVALVLTLDVPAGLRDRLVEGLPLGEDDCELLVELASDRLLLAGFDAEYRPTAEGTALEDLITRLTAIQEPGNEGDAPVSEHVKVAFELESSDVDGYPPVAVETVWATSVGAGRYAIENTPFYAFGVSRGDVVEAEEVDGVLTFRRVVERSMHSVFRVFVSDEKETKSIRALFAAQGVRSELADLPLITLDVPPEVELESIVAMLEEGWAADRWGYEEGNVPPGAAGDA